MNDQKPGTISHYANFLFRPRTLSTGQERGSKNYYMAEDGLPAWVSERTPEQHEVTGLYENIHGKPEDAVVFCKDALVILKKDGSFETLVYRDIRDWNWFTKDPIATALAVDMKNGQQIAIPCYGSKGAVSLFASFVGRASRLAADPQ